MFFRFLSSCFVHVGLWWNSAVVPTKPVKGLIQELIEKLEAEAAAEAKRGPWDMHSVARGLWRHEKARV